MRFFLVILIISIISACQHYNKGKQKLTKVEKKRILSEVSFKKKYKEFGTLPQDTTVSTKFHFTPYFRNQFSIKTFEVA